MTQWSTDLSTAPRGGFTTEEYTDKNGIQRTRKIEDRQYVWMASKCEKSILSYWIAPDRGFEGRWCGFNTAECPIAWRPYTKGEFPPVRDRMTGEMTWPNGQRPPFPRELLAIEG
ncbi:MAG: hypothetical protein U5K75_02940 [Ahrensia sp.]|nr:hypothetical protein [Ahrensia sp.]